MASSSTKRPWASVNGVLLLDKPRGLTSQTALQRARRVLRAAKAGHTGTLDPLAEGLLPLCFGGATKFAQIHLDADKAYRAVLKLGVSTTTCDAEGDVVEQRPVEPVDPQRLRAVLDGFLGPIDQVPPVHSALKKDGRPLYAYARAGQEVEVAARQVRIDAIDIVAIDGDRLTLDVRCGKGTYIRALARDIGERLGCGAHLAALRRTASGPFRVEDAIALDAFEALDESAARQRLLPADVLVADWPRADLDVSQTEGMLQGRRLRLTLGLPAGRVRAYGRDAAGASLFLGAAEWDGHVLAPQRLLSNDELRPQ